MAILSDAERAAGNAKYQEEISREQEVLGNLTKHDIRAAYDALDQFFNDNAAVINNALPQAAKQGLTTPQKARLLTRVIYDRYISGK